MPQQFIMFTRNVNSAIILKISPIIRTKCFSLPDNISCFNDLAVVLYYEITELGSGYERVNVVLDRYFNQSLKEGARNSRGTGAKSRITELSEIPKSFECFDFFYTPPR